MALITNSLVVTVANTRVIDNANLSFSSGQCWAVLGANGAGKTTLLHTLAGLRNTESGEVELDGQSLKHWQSRQRARRISVVMQDQSDVFPLTVREAVTSGRFPYRGRFGALTSDDESAVSEALRQFDIESLQNRVLQTLSGGEQRRVALATLAAQKGDYLLLDEPINHLDLHYQIKTLDWIRGQVVKLNKTAICVLHDLNIAYRYCNHAILLLGDGEFLAGPIDDLLTEQNLLRLYQHPIRRLQIGDEMFFSPASLSDN